MSFTMRMSREVVAKLRGHIRIRPRRMSCLRMTKRKKRGLLSQRDVSP
jgi:hypothetical protein